MTGSQKLRIYRALRRHWNEPARDALRMAKAWIYCVSSGVRFEWEYEQERPEDVFGTASTYECENCGNVAYSKKEHGACCDEPLVRFHDTGVYIDPTSTHLCCVARDQAGNVLDSLGMIDGAGNSHDPKSYGFLVECQMALEVSTQLDDELVEELTA